MCLSILKKSHQEKALKNSPGISYQTKKIAALLGDWPLVDEMIDVNTYPGHGNTKAKAYDHCILVSDLASLVGMQSSDQIPRSLTIQADNTQVDETLRILKEYPRPWWGLTWQAGTQIKFCISKSVPLDQLTEALSGFKGTLFILQRLPAADDIQFIKQSFSQVFDAQSLNEDLKGMLALLLCLDDYITVSNTNVHLSALVQKSAKVLLPFPAEFRWMNQGKESPWFPGFPLYRQSAERSWHAALAQLRTDLRL